MGYIYFAIKSRGNARIAPGNKMTKISTRIIGIKIIATSLRASTSLIFPNAQAINKHNPYGGVTRPKASEITPIIAK